MPPLEPLPSETSTAFEQVFQHSRLAPFRVGSVPYLNAVPLTFGLEQEIIFVRPSQLARMLRANELDAALVSITEVLFHDAYEVLDGVAVASMGEVKSVFLAHRIPIAAVREVFCDTASLTSVNLLRVLLADRGLHPTFAPLPRYADAAHCDAVLLIGDPALNFLNQSSDHEIFDLGSAWLEMTGLPFVYAVWALRRGATNAVLRQELIGAQKLGLDLIDQIILSRPEFEEDFRRDYLTWHIHYHLGEAEKRGVQRFVELLRKHGSDPVFEPHYVE